MKKLALLLPSLLALPFAAWASPQKDQSPVGKEFATATANCTSNNIAPTDAQWGPCVNRYLQTNYKYQLIPIANRWLVMVRVVLQFAPNMVVLPVQLPATTTSWKLPVGYQGIVYREGNSWCATPGRVDAALRACSAKPEVAFMNYAMNLQHEPTRWPHL
jgi:hypothetical protein